MGRINIRNAPGIRLLINLCAINKSTQREKDKMRLPRDNKMWFRLTVGIIAQERQQEEQEEGIVLIFHGPLTKGRK